MHPTIDVEPSKFVAFAMAAIFAIAGFSPLSCGAENSDARAVAFLPVQGTELSVENLSGMRAVLPITMESAVDSAIARTGDPVEARLKDDFRWGTLLIAHKNSLVCGHVVSTEQSRTLKNAIFSSERRWHSRGTLTLQFDQIIDSTGMRWPIDGKICSRYRSQEDEHGPLRDLRVDKDGTIVRAEPGLSKPKTIIFDSARVATMVPLPGGIALNVLGVPAAMGAAGAASPSFAYNKPVEENDQAERRKAFIYAFLTSLPGAFFVQACVERGNKVELKPGDELALDLTITPNRNLQSPQQSAATPQLTVSGTLIPEEQATVTRLYPVDQAALLERSKFLPVLP